MFRIQWKLPIDTVVPPLPPNLEEPDTDKYWIVGGFGRCDISKEPEVSRINYVQSIESCKPWESLKLPIDCTMCMERKRNWPYLHSVHWCYLHCRTCKEVFICEECFVTADFQVLRASSHEDHEFVRIQTRPRTAPLFDGSQLEQLQCFQKASSGDEFFLYFPWFFHSFPGMDNFRDHYSQIFIKDMELNHLDQSSPGWQALRQRLDFPTDWFMRSFAQGDWKPLHLELGPTIEAQIQTAMRSKQLCALLRRLQKYNEDKFARYGASDIPAHPTALLAAKTLGATLDADLADYFIYTIPVQFSGVLNNQIDQENIQKLASTTESSESSINSSGMDCLWKMFNLIYGETPLFGTLIPSEPSSPTAKNFHYVKPEWVSFVAKDHRIRTRLQELRIQEESGIPSIQSLVRTQRVNIVPFVSIDLNAASLAPAITPRSLAALWAWESGRTPSQEDEIMGSLAWCASQRQIGNFQEAIAALRSKDITDPGVALELQRAYMEQGYLEKAMHCLTPLVRSGKEPLNSNLNAAFDNLQLGLDDESDISATGVADPENQLPANDSTPVARQLVMLISKYLSCSVSGDWDRALDFAEVVFESYLRTWRLPFGSKESPLLLIRLEIYYHLILLEVGRDLSYEAQQTNGIERLRTIRQFLMKSSILPDVVWEIMLVELELQKPTGRAQYWDHEMNFSVHQYKHRAAEAGMVVLEYYSWLTALKEKSPLLEANTLIFLAELLKETGGTPVQNLEALAHQAVVHYTSIDSVAGFLDAEFFLIKCAVDPPFSRVKSCYDQLRLRNDIRRMRTVRAHQMAPNPQSSDWLLLTRESLRQLAYEAGDNVAYHRWNLRRYAADNMIVSSISSAEDIIAANKESYVHSNLLTTMASFNLSRAYLTLGNHFEAASNGILHAALTSEQNDVEDHQRAILNLLQIFTGTLEADKTHGLKIMNNLSHLWSGWLQFPAPKRWEHRGPGCDEVDRFIDGACFLPILSGKLGRASLGHDTWQEDTLVSHLQLAFSLYDSLPEYMLSMVAPKLALAVGAVAVYVGNKELAIRSYWEGARSCHSQDLFTLGNMRLETGKAMTVLAELDPEHWVHVVPPARSLIRGAEDLFMKIKTLSGSILKIMECNLWLLRSIVAQARAFKLTLDRTWNKDDSSGNVHNLIVLIKGIGDALERANRPMWAHEPLASIITERLRLENPYDATRHMVSLSASHVLEKTRHLILEVCLIMKDIEHFQGKDPGASLWFFTQRFKGSVLFQQSQYVVNPGEILQDIENDPEASRIYAREQELIREGPQSLGDRRLNDVSLQMEKNPILAALMNRRTTRGIWLEDLEPLEHITYATTTDTTSIITIDWIQYNDIFMVIGFNITLKKIVFVELTRTYTATDVKKWVGEHLKVSPASLPETLGLPDIFCELRPLVSMISKQCKEGDLLVFCPSQLLNAVPLHAIPYNDTDNIPILFYHPIVYAPNNAILRDCVQRALNPRPGVQFHASLFGRYGDSRPAEEEAIKETLEEIEKSMSSSKASVKTILGKDLTRTAFSSNLAGADILHFQGHVLSSEIKQFLVLEPDEPSKTEAFTLQDIFSTGLDASLAVLMGCGSGSQVVTRGDDAIGLISAFFAAGVTSVIGTLWPLDNTDAVKFSRELYMNILQPKEGGKNDLVNLATAVRAAVLEIRACQRPRCKERRDLKGRLKCHLNDSNAPYHWAQFALWGSWVCQGIGEDGITKIERSWTFSKQPQTTTETKETAKTAQSTNNNEANQVEEMGEQGKSNRRSLFNKLRGKVSL